MRHRKANAKLGRTSSHRGALFANMLKELIFRGKIVTTVPKAKALKRLADKMVTLGKKDTLEARRSAISKLRVRFNRLTPKDQKAVKEGDKSSYNVDRQVIDKLFTDIAPKYADRQGGYTRIIRMGRRRGDDAQLCQIEYI